MDSYLSFELEQLELKEYQSGDTAESKQVSETVWLGKVWVCQQSWDHQECNGFGEDEAFSFGCHDFKERKIRHCYTHLQTVDPRFSTRGLLSETPSTWGPMTSACVLDTRVPVFPG